MKEKGFKNIENDFSLIEQLRNKHIGIAKHNDSQTEAGIEIENAKYSFKVGSILDMDADELEFDFVADELHLKIYGTVVAHHNSINTKEKWISRYSEIQIHHFNSPNFTFEQTGYFRSFFYAETNRILYDYFKVKSYLSLIVNNHSVLVSSERNYIIIESKNKIDYETFSEICYNIQVAIGFISGKFIQNEVYTFQYADENKQFFSGYEYRTLRSSALPLYQAITHNPHSYNDRIGTEKAEQLYKNNTLKPFDDNSLSKLTELILNHSQIQYALVLFNEANAKHLSLLIKNNCFYAVLEVFRKFFYEEFKAQLPNNYSQKGNTEKYKMVFNNLISITDEDSEILEKRNVFLHGDIKDIEGREMVEVMQKQITFIYRLILAYVGFDGYVIDHYAINNNMPDKAFVKVN